MAPNPPSTCLFLPELPADLSDTALERLFRGFVGFTSCRTRHDRNGKLVGFVEFEQVDDSVRARDSMQGQSPFPGVNWHIHYSNNTKGAPGGATAKRPREEYSQPVARHDAVRPNYGMTPMPPPPMSMSHLSSRDAPPPPGHHPSLFAGTLHAPPLHPQSAPPDYLRMQLPADASSTLYVEGLPSDATEREVSHIFRRFEGQGYQSIRMLARESNKQPGSKLYLCFVEFDNPHQATVAMHQLQGYRVDKGVETAGVKISYAKTRPPRGERVSGAPRPPRSSETPATSAVLERHMNERDAMEQDSQGGGGHRRDGREHRDSYRDEYEDSERGDP